MPKDTCTQIWIGTDPENPQQTKEKVCGFDLTEAKRVRGKDLVRCPECGRKLA